MPLVLLLFLLWADQPTVHDLETRAQVNIFIREPVGYQIVPEHRPQPGNACLRHLILYPTTGNNTRVPDKFIKSAPSNPISIILEDHISMRPGWLRDKVNVL
ncbi:hypothetical protein L210DRAFT_101561 [Boletus edulis BED1]|uniref:Uncharacterized protein n=1 Tax=Boletus edulis BED1 TaxID=1328754 RepID=A0AAD4BVX3_BOLED|nr:hypothetical protein L210DRAFT_101561 [Boletus edulis BED1]